MIRETTEGKITWSTAPGKVHIESANFVSGRIEVATVTDLDPPNESEV